MILLTQDGELWNQLMIYTHKGATLSLSSVLRLHMPRGNPVKSQHHLLTPSLTPPPNTATNNGRLSLRDITRERLSRWSQAQVDQFIFTSCLSSSFPFHFPAAWQRNKSGTIRHFNITFLMRGAAQKYDQQEFYVGIYTFLKPWSGKHKKKKNAVNKKLKTRFPH